MLASYSNFCLGTIPNEIEGSNFAAAFAALGLVSFALPLEGVGAGAGAGEKRLEEGRTGR